MLQEQSAAIIAAAASSAADMLKEEIEQKEYLASSNPVGRLLSEMECTDLIYPVCKQMGIFEVEELHAALLIAPADHDPQHHQNNTTKLHKNMEKAEINVRWQWRKLEDYLLHYNNRKHYIAAIHHQDFEQIEKAVRLRQLISNKQPLNQVLEARGLQRFQSYLQDIMHLTHSADLAHVVADDCQHWIANLQPEITSIERDRLTHLLEDARKAKENLECIRQEYLPKNPAAKFLDGIVKLPYLIEPLCKDLGVWLESELLNVDVEDFLAVGLSAIDLKGLQETPALMKVSSSHQQSSSTDSKNQASRKPLQSIMPMTTGSSDGNSTTSSGGAMMAAAGAPYQLDMNTFSTPYKEEANNSYNSRLAGLCRRRLDAVLKEWHFDHDHNDTLLENIVKLTSAAAHHHNDDRPQHDTFRQHSQRQDLQQQGNQKSSSDQQDQLLPPGASANLLGKLTNEEISKVLSTWKGRVMFRRLLELRDLVKESETIKEKQTQDMALRNPAAALLVRLHCHELIDPVCCEAFAFEELDLQHEACRRHVPSGTTTSSHHLHWKKIDLHLERILAEASAAHPSVVEQRRKNKRCLNLVKQPLEPLLELRGLQRHKVSFMELGLQAALDLLLLEEPKVMESLRQTVPPDGHAWTDVELFRLRRVLDDIGVGRQLLREEAVGGQMMCILSGGGGDNELRMWDLVEGICLMVMPAPTPATLQRDPSSASGHLAVVNNSVAAPGPSGRVAAPPVPVAGVIHASSVATGHSDRVFGVVVSQDGSAAWSAGWDRKVLKWELATGAQVQDVKFEGHQGWVTGIALSPDESRVVTCCWDKVVRVWGADDGRLKASLQGHSDSVACISVSPDGLYAVSGGWDHALCVWDMNTLKLRDCMKVHSEVVMGVDVCGNKVLSGSDDGTAKLWKLSARGTLSKRPVMELKGHSGGVTSIAFSPDGTFAFTASKDGTLRYWDVEAAPITSLSNRAGSVGGAASASANCLAILKGHTDWVMTLAVAPNGRTVVSGGRDRVVMVWDVLGGGSGSHNATSVAGPAISSAAPATLKMPAMGLGAPSTLKPIQKFEGHSGCVWSVSIVPNVGHRK